MSATATGTAGPYGSLAPAARALAVLVAVASALPAPPPAAAQDPGALLTAPERTDHRETTRYADVVAFMEAAAARSPRIHLETFGYTIQGRALPLAVVGRVADGSPEAVRASGRLVVYLQGSIHAGEAEGKESLLMLLREVAEGRHGELLDSLVLLVGPIYNADGNESVDLGNRPRQHGPVGGMGTRPNAMGLNLNRDHTKLEAPEARSLARMLDRYDAHVYVDLHTTNGTRHAYHLTWASPLHPDTHPAIDALTRSEWLPFVTENVRRKHGWEFYSYGNVGGQGDARGWYTFDHRPRFGNNYMGLRNRIGILSEAYSYATFPDRILATSRFVEEVLAFARAHASRIRAVIAEAEAESVIGQRLAVAAEHARSPEPVTILMGEVVEEPHPYTGETMLRRVDVRRPESMFAYGTFQGTQREVAPAAYVLVDPAASRDVLRILEAHGVRTFELGAARTLEAETFRVDSTRTGNAPFEGHLEREVFGAWVPGALDVPAGAVVVPMDQPLARLAFHLLEPRADDGLVHWNVFDESLEATGRLPIARTHRPVPR